MNRDFACPKPHFRIRPPRILAARAGAAATLPDATSSDARIRDAMLADAPDCNPAPGATPSAAVPVAGEISSAVGAGSFGPTTRKFPAAVALDGRISRHLGPAVDGTAVDWKAVDWTAVNWASVDWASVDWAAVDWSAVDWPAVDWSAVDWPAVDWSAVDWAVNGSDGPQASRDTRPARNTIDVSSTPSAAQLRVPITVHAINEPTPGPRWKALFDETWPAYRAWYLADAADVSAVAGIGRPDLITA